MASYSKDDFVTGSDLSDLSDLSEEDLDVNDIVETNWESEDDDYIYCICGRPSSTEMIACDDELCPIIWWHYVCAGLSAEEIPDGTWVCPQCRPSGSNAETQQNIGTEEAMEMNPNSGRSASSTCEQPSSSTETSRPSKQKQLSEASKKTSESSKSTTTSAKSKSSKNGKKKDKPVTEVKKKTPKTVTKRPKANFTEENARQNAHRYVKTGLEQARQNPVFTANYAIALCILGLVTKLFALTDRPEFHDFCIATVTAMWSTIKAGDSKNLKPEAYEITCISFHKFRLESICKWKEVLATLGIHEEGQHVYILYQYLLQVIMDLLLKDRNKSDLQTGDQPVSTETKPISKDEEQVLRYVAGYVPYALNKKLATQKNASAQIFCKFLKSWQVCCSNTAKTFLEYTNQWIEVQNRGGLFHVSDGVYLLFRNMEMESRHILNLEKLDTFPGLDIQTEVANKIKEHHRVQMYWCSLTQGKINGENSSKLLDMVIKLWIKIRVKAFINVYLNLKKRSGASVSKKAEKALRKDL